MSKELKVHYAVWSTRWDRYNWACDNLVAGGDDIYNKKNPQLWTFNTLDTTKVTCKRCQRTHRYKKDNKDQPGIQLLLFK